MFERIMIITIVTLWVIMTTVVIVQWAIWLVGNIMHLFF